jgi:hypothetical protein
VADVRDGLPRYTLQMLCMAVAGFIDRSPNPTWPRRAAYFNVWAAFSGMGGGIAVFFKHGPFAWNGIIGFYAPLTVPSGVGVEVDRTSRGRAKHRSHSMAPLTC